MFETGTKEHIELQTTLWDAGWRLRGNGCTWQHPDLKTKKTYTFMIIQNRGWVHYVDGWSTRSGKATTSLSRCLKDLAVRFRKHFKRGKNNDKGTTD